MKIIVGLGNPDRQYDRTFHNIGFRAIDKFAQRVGASFVKRSCDAIIAECYYCGEKLILAKPLTYMNASGMAVRQLCNKYKLSTQNVYVFVDDIDLPLGKIRYRENGSAGTHNGLRSIVAETDANFRRIKIGIGRDEKFADLADFVLSKIPDDKMEVLDRAILEANDLLLDIITKKD